MHRANCAELFGRCEAESVGPSRALSLAACAFALDPVNLSAQARQRSNEPTNEA